MRQQATGSNIHCGTSSKPVVLNGSRAIDEQLYAKCIEQMNLGKMPKDEPLTSQSVADAVRDDLKSIVRTAAQ